MFFDESITARLSGAKTASLSKPKEKANDGIDIDQYLDDLDVEIDILKDYLLLITESNIPGTSLNGKDPCELNVLQLRRWLACRGAPTAGRKPELIER